MDIRQSYDSVAAAYVEHLYAELLHKPLDRHLLNRFAESMVGRGLVADLGCGPGHVAKYLSERDVAVCGIDLSPEMIRRAALLDPSIDFRVGNMLALDLPDSSLAGIVAFYSIVHFGASELAIMLRQCKRVLKTDGLIMLAFHIGDKSVHLDEMFGCTVSLDFQFHLPPAVEQALVAAQFVVIECTEREPYDDVEYASRRCYMLARAG